MLCLWYDYVLFVLDVVGFYDCVFIGFFFFLCVGR